MTEHASRRPEDGEDLVRLILENANDPFVTIDAGGRIVRWNDQAEATFGWSTFEAIGRSLTETLIPSEFCESYLRSLNRFLQNGQATIQNHRIEVFAKHRDGHELPVELRVWPILVDGAWTFNAFLRDLSPQRKTEAQMNERVRIAELIADVSLAATKATPICQMLQSCTDAIVQHLDTPFAGIWSLNESRNLLELQASSSSVTQVNGSHDQPPVGQFSIDFIAQERKPHWTNSVIGDTLVGDQEWARRERIVAFAGYPLVVDERVIGVVAMFARNPLSDATRQALAAIADQIAVGIERKRTEEAFRRCEEHLRQSQKMEAIGRLAGGVAHDFNNILTVILGYCEMLLDGLSQTDPKRPTIEEIKENGGRAATLTKQLLAFGRGEVLNPVAMNLNSQIEKTKSMLCRLIGEDIELVTNLSPNLGTVIADPGQIEQVLMNLAVNSRDAMPHGGRIFVETANAEVDEACAARHPLIRPGAYVRLTVSDTGDGMDAETCAHVFEPFFSTKAPGRGTGLGLATVYGIIKQSHGHIWVYSEPGRGTAFKIDLPRVDSVPSSVESCTAVSDLQGGSETVLVVEDQAEVRTLIRCALEKHGYRVIEAGDGAQAIQIVNDSTELIHLLLADVVMPHVGGPDLARRISERWPCVKTLFMSGYSESFVARSGSIAEKTPVVQKPFSEKTLLQAVRSALNAERA